MLALGNGRGLTGGSYGDKPMNARSNQVVDHQSSLGVVNAIAQVLRIVILKWGKDSGKYSAQLIGISDLHNAER